MFYFTCNESKNMKVSLLEISYKKKLTFSRHSNLLRCTCKGRWSDAMILLSRSISDWLFHLEGAILRIAVSPIHNHRSEPSLYFYSLWWLSCWETRTQRPLCSLLYPTTKHLHCLWDSVVATAAQERRKCQTAYNWHQRSWAGLEQYDVILLRKSKRHDNWDWVFLWIKKKEWTFCLSSIAFCSQSVWRSVGIFYFLSSYAGLDCTICWSAISFLNI